MHTDIEVRGDVDFALKVKARAGISGRRLRNLLEEAGAEGEKVMLAGVPRSGRDTGEATAAGAIRSQLVYSPGGAGGGGNYEVHVGIDVHQAPGHLIYRGDFGPLVTGTGIYYSGNLIKPHEKRALTIGEGGNGSNLRAWSRGYRGRYEWLDAGYTAARSHLIAGVREVTRSL